MVQDLLHYGNEFVLNMRAWFGSLYDQGRSGT
jgi:hypothetical protein